jgi:hypothetical protein
MLDWTVEVSKHFPSFWVGLNLLSLSAMQAFEILPDKLLSYVKAIWADDASIFVEGRRCLFSDLRSCGPIEGERGEERG